MAARARGVRAGRREVVAHRVSDSHWLGRVSREGFSSWRSSSAHDVQVVIPNFWQCRPRGSGYGLQRLNGPEPFRRRLGIATASAVQQLPQQQPFLRAFLVSWLDIS